MQIISDLHIEYKNDQIPNPLDYITPVADILVLAGDIGSLYKYDQLSGFLKLVCSYFKYTIYIPGNHEYYIIDGVEPLNGEILNYRLYNLKNEIQNLYILDRSCLIIDDLCIAGCTLWSYPLITIPNFVKIYNIDTQTYYNNFLRDIDYIQRMIKYTKKYRMKLIVITHYCPSFRTLEGSDKKYRVYSIYASKLDYLLNSNYIDTWVCGHTHHNFDFISEKGTRIVSNQYGKPKDNITNFSKEFSINL